jgi:hypothetical protein
LINYIKAFKQIEGSEGALGKNKVGQLFYKTYLSRLVEIYGGLKSLRGGTLINVYMLKRLIVKHAGVEASDKVIPGGQSVSEWLHDVLMGEEDKVAKALIDSNAIPPNELGKDELKEWGPVMENRRIWLLDPEYKSRQKDYNIQIESLQQIAGNPNVPPEQRTEAQGKQKLLKKAEFYSVDEWVSVAERVYDLVTKANKI